VILGDATVAAEAGAPVAGAPVAGAPVAGAPIAGAPVADEPASRPLPGWSIPAALSAVAHGVILLGLAARAPLHAAARPPISVEIVRPAPKPVVVEPAVRAPEPPPEPPKPKRAPIPRPQPRPVATPPSPPPTTPPATPPPATPPPAAPIAAPTTAPGAGGGDNAVALPVGSGALTGTQPGGSTTAKPQPGPPRRTWDYGPYLGRVTQRVAGQQRYPQLAIEMGQEGVVEILVRVRRDGTLAERPRVGRSSGHELLDAEAVRMVAAAAPFAPLPSEEAVTELRVPVRFHLEN
jgi:protein TonB